MKNIFCIIALIVAAGSILPQELTQTDTELECVFLTQGYVFEPISGKGFLTSTGNHISNISSSNPAALEHFQTVSFGASYQAESAIKPAWITDINHERDNGNLPQSLGLVVPYKSLRFGLGMSQRYNSILNLGTFEKTTMEHPEGTGEFITLTNLNTVRSYSGLVSYSFHNAIMENDQLSIGVQYNYNLLDVEERLYYYTLDAELENSGWTYGLIYAVSDRFKLGAFYEANASFRGQVQFGGKDLSMPTYPYVGGDNQMINPVYTGEYTLLGRPPDKFHAGFLYRLISPVTIAVDLNHVYWSQLSENTSDHDDFSLSVTGEMTKNISLSLSLLSTDRRYDDELNDLFHMNGRLTGFLFLTGLNFKMRHFDLDFAFVTDVFNSGEWRKQNIAKIGLGVYL